MNWTSSPWAAWTRCERTPVTGVRSHLVYAAHGDDVQFTMVDGEVVYDGEPTRVDAERVRERAQELAEAL